MPRGYEDSHRTDWRLVHPWFCAECRARVPVGQMALAVVLHNRVRSVLCSERCLSALRARRELTRAPKELRP